MVIGVGIIGTNFGGKFQGGIIKQVPGMEVVALYSRTLTKAKQFCEREGIKYAFDSVDELVNCPEVQVVTVTSPTYLHAEHALKALRAGKHVLCDKPAGVNAKEVEELVKEARSRPNQFAVIDHEGRYAPCTRAARQAIQFDKAIGELRHFDLHQFIDFGHFGQNFVWWNSREQGGGVMGSAGIHNIDVLRYITGQKVTNVNAMGEIFVKEKRMHPKEWKTKEDESKMLQCTAEEYVTAQFKTDGGAVGTMNQSAVARGMPPVYKIDFVGSTGSVRLDISGGTCTLLDATGKTVGEVKDTFKEGLHGHDANHEGAPANNFYNLCMAMKLFLEEGKRDELSLACNFEDTFYNQQVYDAIFASCGSGQMARL